MGIFGGGPESVMKKGVWTNGRIVGISVKEQGSEPPVRVDEYAIELQDGRVLGARQRLEPDDVVRLGMPVAVWVHRDDLMIDWATSTSPLGVAGTNTTYAWKSVDPPAWGITDSRLGLEKAASKWTAATIDIRGSRTESVMFGLAQKLLLDLVITPPGEQPFGCDHRLDGVPHYASHLPTVGRRLTGYFDPGRPDRVRIDWPAAAMADPGLGVAPVKLDRGGGPDIAAAFGWSQPPPPPQPPTPGRPTGVAAVVDPPPPINGVSFDQWLSIERELRARKLVGKPKQWDSVAAEFGVAPGIYATTSGQWAMAMIRRPDLAAAYAAAIA